MIRKTAIITGGFGDIGKATARKFAKNGYNVALSYYNTFSAEFIEELKSYKDLEEQGLLVRLPCKVGEKLWCIVDSAIRELRVHHFDMPAFGTTDIVFRYADGFKLERFV